MKDLKEHIVECLKIGAKTKVNTYSYHPKDRIELAKLIYTLIEKHGNSIDLNDIDTSAITDMSYMFSNSEFNGDISRWDVSNVRNMCSMFSNSEFNGDISNWNVSNVTDMYKMFINSPLEKNPPKWYKEQ